MKELELIGAKLKVARSVHEIRQEDFYASLGVRQSTVSNYEKGIREPPARLFTFLRKKGVDLNLVFDDRIDLLNYRQSVLTGKLNPDSNCENCKLKDEKIAMLTDNLTMCRELVSSIKTQLGNGEKPMARK